MLTPRYNKLSELLEDFQAKLNGMDEVQPTVEASKRDRPAREPDPIVARTSKGKRIRASGQMEDAQSSEEPEEQDEVEESVSPIYQYKVMAGLVEHEMVPRDPGLWGTTRFNEAYVQEAVSQDQRKLGKMAMKMQDAGKGGHDFDVLKHRENLRAQRGPKGYKQARKLGAFFRVTAPRELGKQKAARVADEPKQPKLGLTRREDREVQEGGGSRRTKSDRQIAVMDRIGKKAKGFAGFRKKSSGEQAMMKNMMRYGHRLSGWPKQECEVQEGGGSRKKKPDRWRARIKKDYFTRPGADQDPERMARMDPNDPKIRFDKKFIRSRDWNRRGRSGRGDVLSDSEKKK